MREPLGSHPLDTNVFVGVLFLRSRCAGSFVMWRREKESSGTTQTNNNDGRNYDGPCKQQKLTAKWKLQ